MRIRSWIGGAALVLLGSLLARAQDAPQSPRAADDGRGAFDLFTQPAVPAMPLSEFLGQELSRPLKLSDYWLGVECYPAGEALAAQLRLPEGEGLAVENVVPESPAAAAGLKRHDVLLSAGGEALGQACDLIAAVEKAKEEPLEIDLIRGGQKLHISVTPAKRPQTAEDLLAPAPVGPDAKRLQQWIEKVMPGDDGGLPHLRYHILRPGLLLPSEKPLPPLPDDVTITVTRQGQQPARITVKRGEQSWEVTEKELDKLPEDLRPYAQQMLGASTRMFDIKLFGPGDELPPGAKVIPRKPPKLAPLSEGIEKRLDEMDRQIEGLRKSLEGLRDGAAEKAPRAQAPEEKAEAR